MTSADKAEWRPGTFADITLLQRASLWFKTRVQRPLFVLAKRPTSAKARRRIETRFNLTELAYPQIQALLGPTKELYLRWAATQDVTPVVDEVGSGARLMWVGEKNLDRVLLYCHGGAFLFPLQPQSLPFWYAAQLELAARGVRFSVALLSYTLVPEAKFPTPLSQAVAGVQALLGMGLQPRNLVVAGDSAGANLVLQLLSHILHPLDAISHLPPSTRFAGVYLMSPWADLTNETYNPDSKDDILARDVIRNWGRTVLHAVPESQRDYLEAAKARDGWFDGLDDIVEHVLITMGSNEVLRDCGNVFYQRLLKGKHRDVRYLVQEGGVHNDPFLEFDGGKKLEREGMRDAEGLSKSILDFVQLCYANEK